VLWADHYQDCTTKALSSKVSTFSGKILREQAPIQELIARSSTARNAARLGFVTAMEAVWEVARTGAAVPLQIKAEVYASSFYALGRVSYLLIKEKVVIVEPEGGTDDGRGSRKMSTLAE